MARVRVYETQGVQKTGVGLFIRVLREQMPWLPVEEDGRLQDAQLRENFVARIFTLWEFNQLMRQPLTRGALMAFHRRYKLLLLAHSQLEYGRIGPFVASMDRWPSLEAFALTYRDRLMALRHQPATRCNHTNVLMHAQGYFYRYLTRAPRGELTGLIDSYRQGLHAHYAAETFMAAYPDAWLAQQRYFEPYPEALRLRYGH